MREANFAEHNSCGEQRTLALVLSETFRWAGADCDAPGPRTCENRERVHDCFAASRFQTAARFSPVQPAREEEEDGAMCN
jgi:hypothetical protein